MLGHQQKLEWIIQFCLILMHSIYKHNDIKLVHGFTSSCIITKYYIKDTLDTLKSFIFSIQTWSNIFAEVHYQKAELKVVSYQWLNKPFHKAQFECKSSTHWGGDKVAAVSQTTFSNAFYWMKMYEFWFRFHWSLFLRLQSTIFQH